MFVQSTTHLNPPRERHALSSSDGTNGSGSAVQRRRLDREQGSNDHAQRCPRSGGTSAPVSRPLTEAHGSQFKEEAVGAKKNRSSVTVSAVEWAVDDLLRKQRAVGMVTHVSVGDPRYVWVVLDERPTMSSRTLALLIRGRLGGGFRVTVHYGREKVTVH
jgi:hypothetical protein